MKQGMALIAGLAMAVIALLGLLAEPAAAEPLERGDDAVVLAVEVTPDSSGLPGGPQLQKVVNGLAFLSLIALAGGVVAGAVWWGVGSAGGNPVQAAGGKRMVAISLLGAVIVGGAAGLINFFNTLGSGI